jgi:GNAT superfamily N-acetyltransferase
MSKPSTVQVSFREMSTGDIEAGLRLCRASHWNQTARDWELFLRISLHGCRVAVKDGQVVGTVTTVRYEDRFSWIGMVLVDPAERGQGIGSLLMSEAMDILNDIPSIRLDATPAGHKVYEKLQFRDEYGLSRMETMVSRERFATEDNPARPMSKKDLSSVAGFDRAVFGADRSVIIEWIFEGAPEYAWVVDERDTGEIAGFTFGRHGFNFEHLGPVIAKGPHIARQLVAACLEQQVGRRFILDVSHFEPDWLSWLERAGFREQRPFIRMFYRDNPFPGVPSKQFGILGPEFG